MNWRHLRLLFLFAVLQLLVANPLSADAVDDYIREQMNARHIPGLMLMVLKDGRVIKQQAYGFANVELSVATSKDSVFPLASVTKVFTATAVYLLVQEHKIRLEDRITQLLPELPKAWNEITVLNCLSHTSGITDVFPGSPAAAPSDWIAAATLKEALKKVVAVPLLYKPGEKSLYNQTEFLLLKLIVEKASGIPLEEFLKNRIFQPLGLTSARFGDSLDICSEPRGTLHEFHPGSRPLSRAAAGERQRLAITRRQALEQHQLSLPRIPARRSRPEYERRRPRRV